MENYFLIKIFIFIKESNIISINLPIKKCVIIPKSLYSW